MSPYLQRVALSPLDRALLHGGGVLGWRKGAGEARADVMTQHPEKSGASNYGKSRKVAERYLAGEFPAIWSHQQVADAGSVTLSAFRAALHRMDGRNRKMGRPKAA